jgi:hypothetical protein
MLIKTLLTAGAAALLLPLASGAAEVSSARGESRWNREMSFTLTPAEAGRADRVDLSLSHGEGNHRSQYGRTMPLSELEGIRAADFVAGDGGPIRFRIAREAGTIDCVGVVRAMRGIGDCRFTPDEGFAAELAQRGIGRPGAEEQFHLTMAGIGRPLIAELDRQGYERPNVAQLVAIGIHGADLDYLRGLDAIGYRLRSLDRLVEFRIHGVTPQYIAEIAALGGAFRQMPPERLVEMRIHGVTPAFARAMTELGYRGLGPAALVNLRIHGVTEAGVRELAEIGYANLDADTVAQMAIHGVTPAYIREMAAVGYAGLTAQQLIDLRIHGVRADDARAINAALAQAPGN